MTALPSPPRPALTREDAEHLAATAAGFQSLARGIGHHFGGGSVRQTIVEMENSFLFVTAAGEGSCLAVLSPASADAGLIAYEMALLVKRVGQHLSVNTPAGAGRWRGGLRPAMHSAEDRWLDEEAGAVVRPYALTRGRTRPAGGRLDLIALISAVRDARPPSSAWARSIGPYCGSAAGRPRSPISRPTSTSRWE